jgi:hypothetical protein
MAISVLMWDARIIPSKAHSLYFQDVLLEILGARHASSCSSFFPPGKKLEQEREQHGPTSSE